MKSVNEVLGKIKGEENIDKALTGKGSFSKQGFGELVSSMVNDVEFKIPTYDKNGQQNGEVSISDLIRNDLKKTLDMAKYPQKSEIGIFDTCDICTKGLAEAIPYLVEQQLMCGKKFDLPQQEKFNGSFFLSPVEGKTRDIQIRDPKTQENIGTTSITTEDSIQVKAKSPVPSFLQTKVRKDVNGNIIE